MTSRQVFSLLAAALLAAACSDGGAPLGEPRRTLAATAGTSGITLDQFGGIANDPKPWGDAIVATFFWRGSSNTIIQVSDSPDP